jgi:hypothetical protein
MERFARLHIDLQTGTYAITYSDGSSNEEKVLAIG